MLVGIIDADLVGCKKHRFPNLACMKLSGYHKEKGDIVKLLTSYDIEEYDLVYISKVFTETPIDETILENEKVKYGGTGFFFDKAPPLPDEIEHHMPDYHLYDEWIESQLKLGRKKSEFEDYLNASIGFTTRGCIRQCGFCVNKKYKEVKRHSSLNEFVDPERKYICLLDDNILAYKGWEDIFNELQATGKPFKYKQGMDERVLTPRKCEVLEESKYKGDVTFAFDRIEEKELIEEKLKLWRSYSNKPTKLYVLCGYDEEGKYDEAFWVKDIASVFERVAILNKYKSLPYVTRYEKYKESPYRGMYITLARWCNQPAAYKSKSFREFCEWNGENSASMRYMKEFETKYPYISKMYFDMKYSNYVGEERCA